MAVIINEMEVVIESERSDERPRNETRTSPAQEMRPADLEMIRERLLFYESRVIAH
jgi:hypothetical protein